MQILNLSQNGLLQINDGSFNIDRECSVQCE